MEHACQLLTGRGGGRLVVLVAAGWLGAEGDLGCEGAPWGRAPKGLGP